MPDGPNYVNNARADPEDGPHAGIDPCQRQTDSAELFFRINHVTMRDPITMEVRFIAKALPPDRVMQAYPLLQASEPSLTLERWQEFAEGRSNTGNGKTGNGKTGCNCGIIAVESENGYLHGLFTFDIAEDLTLGRTLFIDNIVVADLVRRRPVVEAMIDKIEALAAAHDCRAQRIHLSEDNPIAASDRPNLVELFVSRGNEITNLGLSKQI